MRSLRLLVVSAGLALLAAAPAGAEMRIVGPAGKTIPRSFVGLSVETDVVGSWFSQGSCQSPVRNALRMAGSPELRIGGNSQDRLQPSGPLPSGQKQIADAPFFHAVRCLGATGNPILLGLNLLARDPDTTGDILAAAGGLVPKKQLAITVGNEPNLYGSRLPAPGGYDGYLKLQGDTIDALRRRFGSFLPPIVGPSPAAYRFAAETAQFIRDKRPSQGDAHVYGYNGCDAQRGNIPPATPQALLSRAGTEDLVEPLKQIVAAASSIGARAQITEMNTVACRGTSGVSDSPASALWTLRMSGDLVQAGFSRLQFHTSLGDYDPFVLNADNTITFRPIWSAMLLLDSLWPQGSTPRTVLNAPPGVNAFAARRPGGSNAILAVNSDFKLSHHLVIKTTAHRAQLGRLLGRGAFAVSLNGRTLGWSSGAPHWQGTTKLTDLKVSHGVVRTTLPPATAAWIVTDPQKTSGGPAALTAQ